MNQWQSFCHSSGRFEQNFSLFWKWFQSFFKMTNYYLETSMLARHTLIFFNMLSSVETYITDISGYIYLSLLYICWPYFKTGIYYLFIYLSHILYHLIYYRYFYHISIRRYLVILTRMFYLLLVRTHPG